MRAGESGSGEGSRLRSPAAVAGRRALVSRERLYLYPELEDSPGKRSS